MYAKVQKNCANHCLFAIKSAKGGMMGMVL